jgi:hypothetical protein
MGPGAYQLVAIMVYFWSSNPIVLYYLWVLLPVYTAVQSRQPLPGIRIYCRDVRKNPVKIWVKNTAESFICDVWLFYWINKLIFYGALTINDNKISLLDSL